jgi:predicted RNA binding protein YcfA (HicA-like mRNA interferase family)
VAKFPIDAPREKVIAALGLLGFQVVRHENHVALARTNPDGGRDTLTLPGHRFLKSSTLRAALMQAGIPRDEFLKAYDRS